MNRIPTALAFCLLAVTFILAQQSQPKPKPLPTTYEAAWKQIDSLTQKGLLQSALTQTNALYERAKSERNYPQLAKASIGRGSLTMQLDPAQWPEHIKALETDTRLVPEPARSVLQSILGDAYVVFYQRNRYRIYDRSRVDRSKVDDAEKSADSTDLTTWDGPRIAQAASRAYVASIQNENVLQATPLSAYAPVVQPGDKEGERLRPTLFDLLAHRAIAFFQNTEFETENTVFRFELDRSDYFADPETFAKLTLTSPPNAGQTGRMLALKTYQRLLTFQTKPGAKAVDALVDADLGRLRFVRQYSTVTDKDTLYQQNLERQIARWKGQAAEAEYAITLAQLLQEQGGQYQPLTKPATKRANKRAADLCRDIARSFPKTRAAQQAQVMLDQLTAPSIGATVEAVNEPQKPFRARLEYRNVPQVYHRLYKITPDERFTFGQLPFQSEEQRNKLFTQLLTKPTATEGKTTLPDDGDLNQHAVEMPINGVPVGQYVLLVSGDATFSTKAKNLVTALLTVSRLGFVMNNMYGNGNDRTVYITDRPTGQPLPAVSVQLFRASDRSGNESRFAAGETRQTDANGRVVFPKTDFSQNQQVYFRISQGNDVLFTDNQYIYNNQQQQEESNVQKAILFTDRAIYRPGQPIYVKGLLYEGRDNQFNVMTKKTVELILNDANGETVAKLDLTTNEFGSFTGTFTAPVGRLTGQMTIACEYGQTQIRVEEYKRPTFAVKADTIRQAIRLGQTVRISAKAQTFSGANVDGASVRYRVTRTYAQPMWGWGGWGRGIWPPRQSAPTEIANGETTTDATGAISLSFVATPDATVIRTGNPTFTFEVTLDVTDRAGETRSTTQSLQIGYTALQASLNIPEQIEQGDTKTYAVKAMNQAGIPVAIRQGEVIITRLQAPAQPLRKRLWERPDRQLLTETEFKKLFPNDVYADEDNPLNWPQTRVLTAQPQAVSLRTLAPGEYFAETSVTDSTGEKATQRQFFSVVDERTASPRPDAWVRATKTEVEPGQETVFFVGNTQPGWVLMTVEEKNQLPRHEWIKTDGSPKRVTIPVTERQRGGFVVNFTLVQQGRLLTETRPIQVPFTSKQLTIETLTFRDKLKPGQADEWTIRISGPDKDKVVAEMVAALYDASLDEFVSHQWQANIYEPYRGGNHQWQSNAFSEVQASQLFYRWEQRNGPVAVQYPALLSVSGPIRIRGGMARMAKNGDMAMAASPMAMEARAPGMAVRQDAALNEVARVGYGSPKKQPAQVEAQPVLRKNFNETAFFFPQLQTDSEGRVLLKFTMPDALTRWKLLTFAHTKDLKTGLLTREIVTQKELMVTLNPPRFLREQDTIRLSARINNLTANTLSGTAKLEAFDAMTDQPISQSVGLSVTPVSFSAGPNGSTSATWTVTVPTGLPPVAFRVSATSPMGGPGSFTDAEERVVPVLPNRMLVTDALPFWVNGKETRSFNLSALTGLTANRSVQHERLTVEVTSNPAWTALQSLPYLMEYPYECAEQIASRLYANYLASSLIDSGPAPGRPEFRRVIDGWATNPPKSPLTTNAELKAVTLENSPWLAEAKSETERTARLGQLFDKNRLANEQRIAVEKLRQLQADNGGFRWFSGMEPNLTMTLHVLTVMGRMQALSSANGSVQPAVDLTEIQNKAIQFADAEMKRWVAEHQKQKNPSPSAYLAVQYLYARTVSAQSSPDKAVVSYLQKLIVKNWLSESLQGQALAVMALARSGDKKTAQGILASLKERAKTSDELGMYWPQNQPGTYWYQAPIETQAYLIEAFGTIGQDQVAVQEMKKWLLRQKQTQSWPSTKATTEAINALLQGPTGATGQSTWLATGVNTDVLVGGQSLLARTGKEATTPLGYQKTTYSPAEIKPELGNIRITKNADGPAWGALYWQRFEPLDKIKSGTTSLSVQKTLFVQRDMPNGPVIEPLTAKTVLKPGVLLKVRLVIKTDRLMEYVHLKDSRASGFEPITVLSGYKYRNGLGYYEAPRDASTDFFISSLPIGTHVFEYELRVVQPGDFSAGVATIQCFYAPEFSARSTGTRVRVK